MNADFRLNTSYFEHYKICKLKRRLGSDGVLAHLQLLSWVAKNKPEGVLSGMDYEDICLAAKWDGDVNAFIEQLIDLMLVDEVDGVFCIHNWEKHNGYACGANRRSEAARIAAKAKWEQKLSKTCDRIATAEKPHSDGNAESAKSVCDRNAPSPTPDPYPSPIPDPIPDPTLIPPTGEAKTETLTLEAEEPIQPAKKNRPYKYQHVIDEWNKALSVDGKPRQFRPNSVIQKEISNRIKEGYTEQDLIDCVKGFALDDWWRNNCPEPAKMIRAKNIDNGINLHNNPATATARNSREAAKNGNSMTVTSAPSREVFERTYAKQIAEQAKWKPKPGEEEDVPW